jgi:hypothetical protein
MKEAYLHYIKYALNAGYKVAVECDGDVVLKSSSSYKKIKDEVQAWEAFITLVVRDVEKKVTVGWADVILEKGRIPEESISDYSVTPHNEAWEKAYYSTK